MTVPFELQMIHRLSGVQLFSYRFREDIKLEPTLISGFISAVITFAEELKPSEGKEIVKFIDRGDFVLQVEPGNLVVGLLILSSKDHSFKEKLKLLVREFENKYQEQIQDWSGVSSIFDDFVEEVKQLIPRKPISPYHVPQLIHSDRGPKKLDEIKWAIITKINGQNNISTISEELDLSVDVVQSIISYFEEIGVVSTHFEIEDATIVEPTKKGLNSLEEGSEIYNELVREVGDKAHGILSSIGTQKSLKEIKVKIKLPPEEIREIVELLVSERYLEILPKWKVVLDKKAFQFTRSLEFIDDLFQLVYDETDNWMDNRNLERVKRDTFALLLIRDERASKLISDGSQHVLDRNELKRLLSEEADFNDATERLENLFRVFQKSIERQIGSNLTRDIMCRVYKRLKDEYSELIEQQNELLTMLNWLNQ